MGGGPTFLSILEEKVSTLLGKGTEIVGIAGKRQFWVFSPHFLSEILICVVGDLSSGSR